MSRAAAAVFSRVISAKVCSIYSYNKTINPKLLHDCSIFSRGLPLGKFKNLSTLIIEASKERFKKKKKEKKKERGDDKKNETAGQITQLGLAWLDRLLLSSKR